MKKLFLSILILLLVFVPSMTVKAEKSPVLIYEFYGNGCPHCTNSFAWFDSLKEEYDDYFDLVKYEVWYNQENANLMFEVGSSIGDNVTGVPYIVIGNKSFIGFGESSKQEILDYIISEYEKDESERAKDVTNTIYKYRSKDGVNLNNDFISNTSGSVSLILNNVVEGIFNRNIIK